MQSSWWIVLGDTRVNIIQGDDVEPYAIIGALQNLYAAETAEINREDLEEIFG